MDTILVKKLYLVVKKYDKSYDSSGLLRGELWKWRHDPGYKIVLRVALFLNLRALTFHEEHGAIVSITKSLQQREWLGETNLTFWCIRANIHDENTSRFSLNDDLKLRKKNS